MIGLERFIIDQMMAGKDVQNWSHAEIAAELSKHFHNISGGVIPETKNRDEGQSGLIVSPLIDALGHSTNILIISLFFCQEDVAFTRAGIRSAIKAHKEAMNEPKQKGEFADSRIRDGKSTVNFWIDHLVGTGVLSKGGYPIKFELNLEHDFVTLCRQTYPFGNTNPNSGGLLATGGGVIHE